MPGGICLRTVCDNRRDLGGGGADVDAGLEEDLHDADAVAATWLSMCWMSLTLELS